METPQVGHDRIIETAETDAEHAEPLQQPRRDDFFRALVAEVGEAQLKVRKARQVRRAADRAKLVEADVRVGVARALGVRVAEDVRQIPE